MRIQRRGTKVTTRLLFLTTIMMIVVEGWIAVAVPERALARSDDSPQGPLAAQGVAYGPYRDGQNPDYCRFPTTEEVRSDLMQLRAVTRNLRTYGSAGPLRQLPKEATALGFSVLAGAWLESPKDNQARAQNEAELAEAIEVARSGHAQTIVVGNETLLTKKLSLSDLLKYIARVRASVPPDIKVTTAEPWSIWVRDAELRKAVDLLLVHIYPFWEEQSIDQAMPYFIEKYAEVEKLAGGKPVVVGETGWPSAGTSEQAGVPAHVKPGEFQQRRYLQELAKWANNSNRIFYWFDAYDEEWKWKEGTESKSTDEKKLPLNRDFSGRYPGASWGILSAEGRLKTHLVDLFPSVVTSDSRPTRVIFDQRGLAAFYDMGVDSSEGRRDWLLQTTDNVMRMDYPSEQKWGAVFITVGNPVDPPRPWKDFSAFSTLSFELRGERGGESVEIGIKDNSDPDDGSETKKRILNLSRQWMLFRFPLRMFETADLRRLYVVVEFVFSSQTAQTIYFRNVRYLP